MSGNWINFLISVDDMLEVESVYDGFFNKCWDDSPTRSAEIFNRKVKGYLDCTKLLSAVEKAETERYRLADILKGKLLSYGVNADAFAKETVSRYICNYLASRINSDSDGGYISGMEGYYVSDAQCYNPLKVIGLTEPDKIRDIAFHMKERQFEIAMKYLEKAGYLKNCFFTENLKQDYDSYSLNLWYAKNAFNILNGVPTIGCEYLFADSYYNVSTYPKDELKYIMKNPEEYVVASLLVK